MAKEKSSTVENLMTEIIDKVNELDKNDPLIEYINQRINVCSCLALAGLPTRALIEIKLIILNLQKWLKL